MENSNSLTTPIFKRKNINRLAFKELKSSLASKSLLLSAAVAVGKSIIDISYEVPQLSQ